VNKTLLPTLYLTTNFSAHLDVAKNVTTHSGCEKKLYCPLWMWETTLLPTLDVTRNFIADSGCGKDCIAHSGCQFFCLLWMSQKTLRPTLNVTNNFTTHFGCNKKLYDPLWMWQKTVRPTLDVIKNFTTHSGCDKKLYCLLWMSKNLTPPTLWLCILLRGGCLWRAIYRRICFAKNKTAPYLWMSVTSLKIHKTLSSRMSSKKRRILKEVVQLWQRIKWHNNCVVCTRLLGGSFQTECENLPRTYIKFWFPSKSEKLTEVYKLLPQTAHNYMTPYPCP